MKKIWTLIQKIYRFLRPCCSTYRPLKVLIVSFFCVAGFAHGEAKLLTPTAGIREAILGSSSVKLLQVQLKKNRLQIDQDYGIVYPELEGKILPNGNSQKIESGLLFDVGKLLAASGRVGAKRTVETLEYLVQLHSKIDGMNAAYLDAVSASKRYAVYHMIWELEEQAVILKQRQFKAGNISELELKLAEKHWWDVYEKLSELEFEKQQTHQSLWGLLDFSPTDNTWTLPDHLDDAVPEVPSAAVLCSTLEKSHPGLALMRAKSMSDEEHLRFQQPLNSFQLGLAYSQEMDGAKSVGPAFKAAIPIDFGKSFSETFDAQKEAAQTSYSLSKREAETAIYALVLSLNFHKHRYATLMKERLPLSERITELTQLHYNYMLSGTYELIKARQESLYLELDAVNHLHLFWKAWSHLHSVMGKGSLYETL